MQKNPTDNTNCTPTNDMPLTDSDQQLYPVTVDGQTIELSIDELIAAAEQGLSKMNDAAQQDNSAGTAMQLNNSIQPSSYERFAQAYPQIKPTDIPSEVFDNAGRTGDLLEAYLIYEIRMLRQEMNDLKTNQKNRQLDVGSARSDGQSQITDPIILALMGKN